MKATYVKRNLFLGVITLFIGAFLVSSQGGNIANAVGPDNAWTEHAIATTTPTAPRAVFAIDIDNDGDNDVVSANSNWFDDNKVVWYENLGGSPPSWAEDGISTLSYPTWLTDVFAIDIDDDDDVDVISAALGGYRLAWYENDGGSPPSWATHVLLGGASSGTIDVIPYSKGAHQGPSVFAIDINKDDDVDIIWGNGSDLAWYENLGGSPPSFTKRGIPNSLFPGAPGTSVFAIDIDNDDDIDVLAGTIGSDAKLAWYESDGGSPPSWSEHIIKEDWWVGSLFAIDLDNDGDIDVLVDGSWFENDGSSPPSWTEHNISSFRNVFAIDLDNDGDIDVGGSSGSVILWYENDGGSPPSWTLHIVDYFGGSLVFPINIDTDCDNDIAAGWEEDWDHGEILWFENPFHATGDVNADGVIDLGDVLYLINYLYKGGPAPCSLEAADADCNGVVDLGDVLYLINYLYKGGPAPGC